MPPSDSGTMSNTSGLGLGRPRSSPETVDDAPCAAASAAATDRAISGSVEVSNQCSGADGSSASPSVADGS